MDKTVKVPFYMLMDGLEAIHTLETMRLLIEEGNEFASNNIRLLLGMDAENYEVSDEPCRKSDGG